MADDSVEIPLIVSDQGATGVSAQVEDALRRVGATAAQTKQYLDDLMKVPAEHRDEVVQSLLDVASGAGTMGSSLEALAASAAVTGVALVALGGVAVGLAEKVASWTSEFIEAQNHLQNLSEASGISATALHEWQASASVFGIGAQDVASAVAMLDARLEQHNKLAIEALQRLGLSEDELAGKTGDEKLRLLSQAMAEVAEKDQQIADSKGLFGRSGARLLPALTEEAEKYRELLHRIAGDQAENARTGREWAEVIGVMRAAFDHFKESVAVGALNFLDPTKYAAIQNQARQGGGILNTLFPQLGILGAAATPQKRAMPSDVAPDTSPLTLGSPEDEAKVAKLSRGYAEELAAAYARQREAIAALESPEAAHIQRLKDQADKEVAAAQAKYGDTAATSALIAAIVSGRDAEIASVKAKDDSRIATEIATAMEKERVEAAKAMVSFNALVKKALEEEAVAEDGGTKSVHGKIDALREKAAAEKSAIEDHLAGLAVANDSDRTAAELAKQKIDQTLQLKEAQVRLTDENKRFNEEVRRTVRDQREAEKAARDFERAQKEAWDAAFLGAESVLGVLAQVGGAFGQMLGGIRSGIGQMKAGIDENLKGGEVGGLGGFMQQLGGLGQMASAAVGIAKSIFGLFSHPEYQKVMEDVGKSWGVSISDGLAKQIESTETKDHVSRGMAELLNLSSIMGESGKGAGTFAPQVDQLMDALSKGSIPAVEGLGQIDQAFQKIQQEAAATDDVGNRAMVDIIKHARELNLQDQAISQYVKGRIDDAASNMDALMAGLEDMTPQLAQAEGAIFSDVFWGKVKEEGIVAASKALSASYDKAMADMKAKGITPSAAMQAIGSTLELGRDPKFQATAAGVDASDKILRGLADSAYLSKASFDAFGDTAKAQFDQALKDGASREQAAQLEQKLMSDEVAASANYGYALSQTDKDLIAEMEKSGVHLLKEPVQQQVDLLKQIRDGIYSLAKIRVPADPSGGGVSGGNSRPTPTPDPQPNDDAFFERSKQGRVRIARSAIVDQY